MRSPARLTRLATELRKIVGHAQGFCDGKNFIENSLCGNQLGHLMTADFGVFRATGASEKAP